MDILSSIGGIAGGLITNAFNRSAAKKQAALQKEFAQSGVQWRVEDAKKAGIHPLAALGFQGTSYTPQTVGSADFGPHLASLGNSIYKSSDPATQRAIDLSLDKAGLENELLRAQIGAIRATRTPSPGVPSGRQRVNSTDPPAPEHSGLRGGFTHDPNVSDAQKFEDRYGDIIQEFAGIRNFVHDAFRTRYGMPPSAYHELESMRFRRGRDYGRDYRHR